MWKTVLAEVRELLLLVAIIGGLSLLSMAVAVAAMALGASQYPMTVGF